MNDSFDCRADRDGAPPLKQGSADGETERVEVALGADILVVVVHGVN